MNLRLIGRFIRANCSNRFFHFQVRQKHVRVLVRNLARPHPHQDPKQNHRPRHSHSLAPTRQGPTTRLPESSVTPVSMFSSRRNHSPFRDYRIFELHRIFRRDFQLMRAHQHWLFFRLFKLGKFSRRPLFLNRWAAHYDPTRSISRRID